MGRRLFIYPYSVLRYDSSGSGSEAVNLKARAKVARIQGYCDSIIESSPDAVAVTIPKKILSEATEVLAELRAAPAADRKGEP